MLGPHVISGKRIYLLSELAETMSLKTSLKGVEYEIQIDKDQCQIEYLADSFDGKENSAA